MSDYNEVISEFVIAMKDRMNIDLIDLGIYLERFREII